MNCQFAEDWRRIKIDISVYQIQLPMTTKLNASRALHGSAGGKKNRGKIDDSEKQHFKHSLLAIFRELSTMGGAYRLW